MLQLKMWIKTWTKINTTKSLSGRCGWLNNWSKSQKKITSSTSMKTTTNSLSALTQTTSKELKYHRNLTSWKTKRNGQIRKTLSSWRMLKSNTNQLGKTYILNPEKYSWWLIKKLLNSEKNMVILKSEGYNVLSQLTLGINAVCKTQFLSC